jgi:hypothetical protein
MASLAHRNGRAARLATCRPRACKVWVKWSGFEPMAGDAGFLADRPCVRRLGIHGNLRVRESRRRTRQISVIRAVSGKICRRQRIGDIVGRLRLADRHGALEDQGPASPGFAGRMVNQIRIQAAPSQQSYVRVAG